MPTELQTCSHFFLQADRILKSLEAPFSGPFKVLQRMDRCYKIQLPDANTDAVSISLLKSAVFPPNSQVNLSPNKRSLS